MTTAWGLAAVSIIMVGSVVRDLIGLRRFAIRHESISRLVAQAGPGTTIHDQDRAGTATRIAVGDPTDVRQPGGTDLGDGPAG